MEFSKENKLQQATAIIGYQFADLNLLWEALQVAGFWNPLHRREKSCQGQSKTRK